MPLMGTSKPLQLFAFAFYILVSTLYLVLLHSPDVVLFDNSFSYLKSKTVFHLIEVVEPATTEDTRQDVNDFWPRKTPSTLGFRNNFVAQLFFASIIIVGVIWSISTSLNMTHKLIITFCKHGFCLNWAVADSSVRTSRMYAFESQLIANFVPHKRCCCANLLAVLSWQKTKKFIRKMNKTFCYVPLTSFTILSNFWWRMCQYLPSHS